MKKAILLILLTMILASVTVAENSYGARATGMGGAFTGLADDANALFANPAGIGSLTGEHASISSYYSHGKDQAMVSGVEKTPYGAIGVGYTTSSFSIDDVDATLYQTEGEVPVKSVNQELILSYGRELNDFMVVPERMGRLAFGANVKFLSSKLDTADGATYDGGSNINLDIGVVFKASEYLACGVNVKDLADEEQGQKNLALGLSGKVLNKTITWSVERDKIGCEWKVAEGFTVRAGRNGRYNTGGFGLSQDGYGIDYAFVAREYPAHYFSVSVDIKREKPTEQIHAALYGIE